MRVRLLIALMCLLASGASAQRPDPLRGVSLGLGPASGLDGAAVYSEARAWLSLGPVLAVEPVLGVTGRNGRMEAMPCLFPPCEEERVGRGVGFAPGLALTLGVPKARLPGPLADVHVGVIGQVALNGGPTQIRYGAEVGASIRMSPRLALGLDVQAVRYAWRQGGRGVYRVDRSSLVPLVRLGYAAPPRVSSPEASGDPAATPGVALSASSGFAAGFDGGALQSEVRASLPLGARGLAVEPSLGWTAAFGSLIPAPFCFAMDSEGDTFDCPEEYRTSGADALSLGVGLASHSGRTSALGIGLADTYLGASVHLVSPTTTANSYRFSMTGGAALPLAHGVALGGEVQASLYTDEAPGGDRAPLTLAPMVRLVVGG